MSKKKEYKLTLGFLKPKAGVDKPLVGKKKIKYTFHIDYYLFGKKLTKPTNRRRKHVKEK